MDQATIPDPSAQKPDDWDEDAPPMIPDPEAKIPEGWLENEEKVIPDPNAIKPESWNDEVTYSTFSPFFLLCLDSPLPISCFSCSRRMVNG